MAKIIGPKWCNNMRVIGVLVVASSVLLVSANEISIEQKDIDSNYVTRVSKINSSHQVTRSGYTHVWPDMKLGWRIVVGGIIGFLGAAFGSVGGVGGGGIFVPMLTLIVGFDEKSSTAISKFTSTKSFLKGIEIWKKETIMKKEAARRLQSNGNDNDQVEYNNTNSTSETKESKTTEVPILKNIYWKELGLLTTVWTVILGLQIAKNYTKNCSVLYWVLNFLQIPVTVGVTLYEAISLYKGKRVIASKGEVVTVWRVKKLIICCFLGIMAGMIGGLLGLGGGFIMGPLFLELGIPPQVSSATATLVMAYSSSMSVVEYYLLRRFPVPYALYFAVVATVSALVGQHVVGKVISIIGRASLIIFILSSMIFISAITLGGVGISNTIEKIHNKEYMGFENLCHY
ncbi:sulfite exporter TauE/SafE family protein 3 isoform X2 [Cannabis sativa]|uniref:sulfite exporter TauE/SafE family protein 3 isoform X2 n=1 Tax=Cannabis sativa TaxID=3483 RepID=UPI0029CA7B93|nr:sulfite exporter TauE/SafE family protein 3 isoform X2 [Cannabis sativa]